MSTQFANTPNAGRMISMQLVSAKLSLSKALLLVNTLPSMRQRTRDEVMKGAPVLECKSSNFCK
jgi:hypothetical protein